MDDIQNILYVLVFVIWFLYRAFSGGSKKQGPPKPAPDQRAESQEMETRERPTPVTFEDILRELSGAPPPAPPPEPEEIFQEEVQYEDDPYYEELEPLTQAEPEYVPHKDIVVDGAFKEFRTTETKGSVAARNVFKMLRKKGGLKQAIILKEILDRPYS